VFVLGWLRLVHLKEKALAHPPKQDCPGSMACEAWSAILVHRLFSFGTVTSEQLSSLFLVFSSLDLQPLV